MNFSIAGHVAQNCISRWGSFAHEIEFTSDYFMLKKRLSLSKEHKNHNHYDFCIISSRQCPNIPATSPTTTIYTPWIFGWSSPHQMAKCWTWSWYLLLWGVWCLTEHGVLIYIYDLKTHDRSKVQQSQPSGDYWMRTCLVAPVITVDEFGVSSSMK